MTTTRASAAAAAATTENDFSTPSRTTTDAKPVVTEPQRCKMEQSSGMEVTPPTQQPPTQQQQQQQHEKLSAVTPSESAPRESKEESDSHAEAVALESAVVNSTESSEKAKDSKNDNKGSLLIDSHPGGKHVRFGKEDPDDAMDVEEDSATTSNTPTAAIASLTIKVEEGTESHEAAAAVTPGASSSNHLGTSSSNASAASQRGLVSRRGGRMGSPSKPISVLAVKSEPVVEYKTYRSPSRKRDENDTIPSLCSTSSGGLTSASSHSAEKKLDTTTTPSEAIEEHDADQMDDGTEHRRPSSISCDPSMIDTTSPLASLDETRPTPDANGVTTKEVHPPQHDVGDDVVDSDDDARKQHPPQPNVTFSPPPPPIGESNVLLDKVSAFACVLLVFLIRRDGPSLFIASSNLTFSKMVQ